MMSKSGTGDPPSVGTHDVSATASYLTNRRAGFKSLLTMKRNEIRSLICRYL